MSNIPIKLYSYTRFSAPWRVAIALKLKKVNYQSINVNLKQLEQRQDAYQSINPNMLVPSLEINGQVHTETMAILQYLDEIYPNPSLMPKDPLQRAKIRAICETVNSGIHPYHTFRLAEWYSSKMQNLDRKDSCKVMLTRGFDALNAMLTQTHGKYSFGDQITLADCLVYPQVFGDDVPFDFEWSKYPAIKLVVDNLKGLQEFQPDQ